MNPYSLDRYERPEIEPPSTDSRLLMHSCCAPCAGEVLAAVKASGIDVTVYFYNPNIHPQAEYEMRKAEDIRYCERLGIPHIDGDYDTDNWFDRIRGLENGDRPLLRDLHAAGSSAGGRHRVGYRVLLLVRLRQYPFRGPELDG